MRKNKFFINGHLGHDGSFREVNDKIVVNFSIAETVYIGKDKPEITQWWECELWLTPAQQNYYKAGLIKGAKVFVNGFLFQEVFEKDGVKKTYYKVKVEDLDFGAKVTTQQSAIENNGVQQSATSAETYTKPSFTPECPIHSDEETDVPF